jgi:deoxyribose-phosphate aldolase
MALRVEELAKTIDHPLRAPEPTPADVVRLCDEACAHHFAAVCVGARCVRLAAERLRGCDVKVAGVIAVGDRKEKAALAVRCLSAGAAEIEVALGTDAMLAGSFRSARDDLATVVRALRTANVNTGRGYVLVKVAVDCDRLDDARKRLACLIVEDVDADFVEAVTRTPGVPAIREVELFRDCLPERVGVKVTVPVARVEEAEELVTAGVVRIGTPHAVAMMRSAPTLVEVIR